MCSSVCSKVSDLLFTVSKMTRFQEKTRVETDIKTADIKRIGYISAFLILVEARGIEPIAKQLKHINIPLIRIVCVQIRVQQFFKITVNLIINRLTFFGECVLIN